jgi:hypothetical protein
LGQGPALGNRAGANPPALDASIPRLATSQSF